MLRIEGSTLGRVIGEGALDGTRRGHGCASAYRDAAATARKAGREPRGRSMLNGLPEERCGALPGGEEVGFLGEAIMSGLCD